MQTAPSRISDRTILAGQRIRLGSRRLSAAHVALARRPHLATELADVARTMAGSLSTELKCQVSIESAADLSTTTLASLAADALVLQWDLSAFDQPAFLEVDVSSAAAWVGRLSGAVCSGPARRLTRIEHAALGYLALVVTRGVCASPWVATKLSPRFVRVASSNSIAGVDRTEPYFQARIHVASESDSTTMRLLIPASVLHAAVVSVPPAPIVAPSELGAIGQSQIVLRRFLGRSSLGGDELRDLAPRDVVVLDNVAVSNGRVSGSGRVQGPTFRLAGIFQEEGFMPAQHEDPNMAANDFESGTDLPVEIEVELGRVRVSLAELASLRVGGLLSIPANVRDPVTLRVGDRAIARAELVEIEGQLGARIIVMVP